MLNLKKKLIKLGHDAWLNWWKCAYMEINKIKSLLVLNDSGVADLTWTSVLP
jgi:hypothetical protein